MLTRRSLVEFGVPRRFTGFLGIVLPISELTVAAGLVLSYTVHIAVSAALVLLCVFTIAIGVKLWNGDRPECACFGVIRPAPIGLRTLGRNLLLGIAGLLVLVGDLFQRFAFRGQSEMESRGGLIVLAIGFGLGLAVMGSAIFRPAHRASTRSAFAAKRGAQSRARASPTSDSVASRGLPVGAASPQFEFPLLDGGVLTLEGLVRRGRSVLVVFASPT